MSFFYIRLYVQISLVQNNTSNISKILAISNIDNEMRSHQLHFFYYLIFQQSNKPIWGCYASSVREIRSSSPLETPDEENAFVIRTSEKEFIVRVSSESEKSSWILMIRRVCSYQETR